MKNILIRSTLVLTLATGLPYPTAQAAQHLGFDEYSLDWGNNGSVEMPGRLYVPTNYNPAQKYPLVIFFHGQGEIGTNNTAPVNSVADSLALKIKARNYFMYVPQLPSSIGSSWYEGAVIEAMRQANYAMANYSIDPTRIYVTGLSLGGGGTKAAIKMYSRPIAAAIPVCPTGDSTFDFGPRLLGKPIWAFHGQNDPAPMAPTNSRNFINTIVAAGTAAGQNPPPFPNPNNPPGYPNNVYYYYNWADTLRYVEFKGLGHSIWGRVYKEDDNLGLYDWMASKSTTLADASLRPGETAYFDIGYHANTTVYTDTQNRKWNVNQAWPAASTRTGIYTYAVNSAGDATSVCIAQLSPFAATMDAANGRSRPGYDDYVAKDGWSTVNGATAANPAILKIHGLVPGAAYTMEAYGSHIPAHQWDPPRWSRYQFESVIGGLTQTEYGDLDVSANTSGTAVSVTVNAGDDGAVLLKVFPAPGKPSTTAQLNTLSITRSGSTAPTNEAPAVNAGSNQTTTLYDGVALSGTATDDGNPQGSSLTTTWSKESGPGNVTFSSGTSMQTSAAFDAPGVYVLKLTASDTALTSSGSVTVTVNEWKNMDIGTVPVPGSSVVASGTAVITGSGPNIWQNNDDFHFVFRPVWGDATIIVRQVSHPYQDWRSKSGIMMRNNLTRDASHCFVGMNPGGDKSLYMEHREGLNWAGAGQGIGLAPYFLKLVRTGNSITSSVSPDGTTWVECSTYTFPTLPETMYVGFAQCSGTTYTLTSVFDHITVSP